MAVEKAFEVEGGGVDVLGKEREGGRKRSGG